MARPASLFRAIEHASCEASGSRLYATRAGANKPKRQLITPSEWAHRGDTQEPGEGRDSHSDRAQPGTRFSRNLLVGMPRTSKPSDLMRVMKDLGAVDKNFPMNSITPPPLSLPRAPRPYKSFHVQFRTGTEAFRAYHVLASNPTFFPRSSKLSMVDTTGEEFNESMMVRTQNEVMARLEGMQQAVETLAYKPQYSFNRGWLNRKGTSGRTVSLSGLPFGFPIKAVRNLVLERYFSADNRRAIENNGGFSNSTQAEKQMRLFEDPLGTGSQSYAPIITLPSTPVHSRFGLSFNTVEAALRAARQLNMLKMKNSNGKTYILKASVMW